jgi:GR25 family glycosyltransferase involved in LPS biosynthesis
MSHYEILKKELDSKKNNYDYLMILEDDCNFEENTVNNLNLALNQLIEKNIDWDILYLSSNLKKKNDATKVSNNLLKIYNGLTTTAQLFQINKLQKIIDLIISSESEIDNTYNDFLNEKYCVYPMCAYQRRSYSDIQEMDLNYGHYHNKFIY